MKSISRSSAVLVVLALVSVACGGGSNATVPAPSQGDPAGASAGVNVATVKGDTIELSLGRSVRVPGAGLLVEFTKVAGDSRCPPRVQCVWAGSVRVQLSVTESGGAARTIELESGTDPRSATIGAYELVLLNEVRPAAGERGTYIIRLTLRSKRAG